MTKDSTEVPLPAPSARNRWWAIIVRSVIAAALVACAGYWFVVRTPPPPDPIPDSAWQEVRADEFAFRVWLPGIPKGGLATATAGRDGSAGEHIEYTLDAHGYKFTIWAARGLGGGIRATAYSVLDPGTTHALLRDRYPGCVKIAERQPLPQPEYFHIDDKLGSTYDYVHIQGRTTTLMRMGFTGNFAYLLAVSAPGLPQDSPEARRLFEGFEHFTNEDPYSPADRDRLMTAFRAGDIESLYGMFNSGDMWMASGASRRILRLGDRALPWLRERSGTRTTDEIRTRNLARSIGVRKLMIAAVAGDADAVLQYHLDNPDEYIGLAWKTVGGAGAAAIRARLKAGGLSPAQEMRLKTFIR